MTTNAEQRKLLLQIANCKIAHETLDSLLAERDTDDLPCKEVCNFQLVHSPEKGGGTAQGNTPQTIEKSFFHSPEPWNGNLDTAEILFVSSNPSINFKEDFPKLEGGGWKNGDIERFFIDRLEKDKNYNSMYWKGILKYSGYILDITNTVEKIEKDTERIISPKIALTEIVHCKSQKEIGVKKAARTCYENHTKYVLQYFLESPTTPKVVVFVGKDAREIIEELASNIDPQVDYEDLASFCQHEFGTGDGKARFIFLPHPNARKWKSPKTGVFPSLTDKARQAIIDIELGKRE